MRKRFAVAAVALTLLGMSVEQADAGFFQRLWQLEKRKNAWLKRTFIDNRPHIFYRGTPYDMGYGVPYEYGTPYGPGMPYNSPTPALAPAEISAPPAPPVAGY